MFFSLCSFEICCFANKTDIFAPPCNIPGISAYFSVKHSCRYNKKNIARRLEDKNFFIFLYQKHYVTRCARSKNIVLPLKNKIHIFVSPCNIPSFVHANYPDIFWCSNEFIQLGTIDHKKTVMVATMKVTSWLRL